MRAKLSFYLTGLMLAATLKLSWAQGTAFTYQGQLSTGGSPATGLYDLQFTVFGVSSGGSAVAGPLLNTATPVTNGLFSLTLDFSNGPFSNGAPRWVEVAVRTNSGGLAFTTLSPRQPITAVPYAITASNLTSQLPANQLSGTVANSQLAHSSLTISAGTGLTGGGTVSLGSSTTLNNSGVLSVTGNGDITASPSTGAVTLGSTATSANTAGAIVKRDASGNFSAGSLTLSGNLNLPTTTAAAGSISQGSPILHTFGSGNLFVGAGAGNFITSGSGVNTGVGASALQSLTTGDENCAFGGQALSHTTTGAQNTALGLGALEFNTNGNNNVAIGPSTLDAVTSGSGNIGIGVDAGLHVVTGNNNIFLGSQGVANDSAASGVMRLGQAGTQTSTYIAGIYGVTSSGGVPVYINASHQLGTVTSSARFKQDIRSMGEASDELLALRPVTFRYKTDIDPHGLPQFGLVAEEVEKVDPALVVHDAQEQIYSVRYEAVNAMLLNEFLKEHRKVQEQETELRDLKARLSRLEQLMEAGKPPTR